jgi:hypothetical protein
VQYLYKCKYWYLLQIYYYRRCYYLCWKVSKRCRTAHRYLYCTGKEVLHRKRIKSLLMYGERIKSTTCTSTSTSTVLYSEYLDYSSFRSLYSKGAQLPVLGLYFFTGQYQVLYCTVHAAFTGSLGLLNRLKPVWNHVVWFLYKYSLEYYSS